MSGPTSFKTRQRQGNWDKDENGQSSLSEIEELKRMMSLRDAQIFEMKRTFPSAGSLKKKIRQLVGETHIARHELQQSMGQVSALTTELQELKNSRTPLTYEAHAEELEKLRLRRQENACTIMEKKNEALYCLKAAQLDRSASNSSSAAAETSSSFDIPPTTATTEPPPSFGATLPSSQSVPSTSHTSQSAALNGSQPTNATSSTGRVPMMNGASSSFNVTDVSGTTLKFGKKHEDAREFSSSAKTLDRPVDNANLLQATLPPPPPVNAVSGQDVLQVGEVLPADMGVSTSTGPLDQQQHNANAAATSHTNPSPTHIPAREGGGAPHDHRGTHVPEDVLVGEDVVLQAGIVRTPAGGVCLPTHAPTPITPITPTPSYQHQNTMIMPTTTINGTPTTSGELLQEAYTSSVDIAKNNNNNNVSVTPSSKSSSSNNIALTMKNVLQQEKERRLASLHQLHDVYDDSSRDSAVHLNIQLQTNGGVSVTSQAKSTNDGGRSAFIVTDAEGQDSSPQRPRKAQQRLYSSLHGNMEVEKQIRTSRAIQYRSVEDCALSLMPKIERKLHAHYQEVMMQAAEQQQTAHAPFNPMHSPLLNHPQPNFSFFPTANPFPMFQQ